MRRAIPVIAATAGGLALLVNFKTSPASTSVHTGDALGPSSTTLPSITTPTTVGGSPSTTLRSAPTTSTTAPSTQRRTVDGAVVSNRYGEVQVRLTVTGHHIDDVQALQLPSDRERSAEISDYAAPRLRQEALQAQSADIDILSGATYTSESYARSLQSALDKIR